MGFTMSTKLYVKTYSIKVSLEQYSMIVQKNIRPEHIRRYIESHGTSANQDKVHLRSTDWRLLKKILDEEPSLQVVGGIGYGKTYLVRQLIEHDKKNIYIVLDPHEDYTSLPQVPYLNPENIKQSCRINMMWQMEGAKAMFKSYMDIILSNKGKFDKNVILVIDEGHRYRVNLRELVKETRKFLKCLIITPEELFKFCPCVHVQNHKRS